MAPSKQRSRLKTPKHKRKHVSKTKGHSIVSPNKTNQQLQNHSKTPTPLGKRKLRKRTMRAVEISLNGKTKKPRRTPTKRQLKRLQKHSPYKLSKQMTANMLGNSTASTSQLLSRKLLRSIKRRQLQSHNDNATPQNKRDRLRRKLDFQFKRNSLLPAKSKENTAIDVGEAVARSNEETLEEGEIVSNASETEENNEDTDCICIEEPVEHITVIDDDEEEHKRQTPSCSRVSSGYISAAATHSMPTKLQISIASKNKLTASTPCFKLKPRVPENNKKTEEPFFEDSSKRAFFETINSEDTFLQYSIRNSIMREQTSPSRCLPKAEPIEDVIILEDTDCDLTLQSTSNKRKQRPQRSQNSQRSRKMDDSVIFVSETNPSQMSFIPLFDENVPNPIRIVRNPCSPVKNLRKRTKEIQSDLFTRSEKKELKAYNNNAYDPDSSGSTPATTSKKRMVIIDGSNVAFNHALNREFSVKGLKICIEYFEKMNHEVKAVVPQYRRQRAKSTDPDELEKMHGEGKIIFSPCKSIPGKSSTSYDDRLVLQLASKLDAAVVSNDNYRDLYNENIGFKKIIENRVIGYTWCNDIFILPKDPYGKWGPTLDSILNRN